MNIGSTQRTSIEHLPFEIFLKIFASFSFEEILHAFSGLNSHIDSIIRCVNDGNHAVTYSDTKAIQLLTSYPTQICRLIIVHSPNVNFASLRNLRSLTIKYGTLAQLDSIRPSNFPLLEILHICGVNGISSSDKTETIKDFFQVILSNGFSRLRICTAVGVETLELNEAWTKSPSLRLLFVEKQVPLVDERFRFVCPNLRSLKSNSTAISLSNNSIRNRRICTEFMKLKKWESEKKIILEYGLASDIQKSMQNWNEPFNIYARILPEKDPYCLASFLIEIKLPPEYPFAMPQITFIDPIYHINIMNDGRLCCCWGTAATFRPTTSLVDLLNSFIEAVNRPTIDHCTDSNRSIEYQDNYEQFYEKALQLTLNKGRPRY